MSSTIVLQYFNDFAEDGLIVIKFDLPRTVKDNVIILPYKLLKFVFKPGLVLKEILHTKE